MNKSTTEMKDEVLAKLQAASEITMNIVLGSSDDSVKDQRKVNRLNKRVRELRVMISHRETMAVMCTSFERVVI